MAVGELAAEGHGAAAGAVDHAFDGVVEGFGLAGAHAVAQTGEFGNGVDGGAGVGEQAVNAHVGSHVLAQAVDAHDGKRGGVHGVDALFRRAGGVSGLALEVHFQVGAGNELLLENGAAFGVGGNDGVHVIEEARVGHGHLAAGVPHVAFFGGRAEHVNGSCGKMAGQRYAGGAGRRAEEVVSAGVAEPGQGVEFGEKGHLRAFSGAVHGMEGRGHIEQIAFHLEAVGFKKIGKAGGRLEFLISQFGFGEDGGGNFLHLAGKIIDFIQ